MTYENKEEAVKALDEFSEKLEALEAEYGVEYDAGDSEASTTYAVAYKSKHGATFWHPYPV